MAKNALWAGFAGWALASMNMQMFFFLFTPGGFFGDLAQRMEPGFSTEIASEIVAWTLSFSVLGGWLFGLLSDWIGRACTLRITILWVTASASLCGWAWTWKWNVAPPQLLQLLGELTGFKNYTLLGLTCILLGIGFGGAWTAGAVLVGEWASNADRGKTVGAMQSGFTVGGVVAFLATNGLQLAFPKTAHHWMFWAGAAPVLLLLFVRPRFVVDAPKFKAIPPSSRTIHSPSGRAINLLALPRTLLMNFFANVASLNWWLTTALSVGAQWGYYTVLLELLPALLHHHVKQSDNVSPFFVFTFFSIGACVGYFVGGCASDRFGRHGAFTMFALGSTVTASLCVLPLSAQSDAPWGVVLLNNTAVVMLLIFLLSFSVSGVFSGIGPFLSESFPTSKRGSMQGSSYSFGRRFAYNLVLIGAFGHEPLSILVFVQIAYVLVILAAWLLDENTGHELP